MNRPRLARSIRIAFSAVCGIACVLLVVLWVRSNTRVDGFWVIQEKNESGISLASVAGHVNCTVGVTWDFWLGRWEIKSRADNGKHSPPIAARGFAFDYGTYGANSLFIKTPYWFLLTLAAVPLVPHLRYLKHFSLRTLLIATTLVAVVLGLIVWAVR